MSVLQHAAARWLSLNYDEMVSWRRHLHAHPELSYQEFETAAFVQRKLTELGIPFEVKAKTVVAETATE